MTKKLAIDVLLDYLLETPGKLSGLLDGLDPPEFHSKAVVRTAVTCNLYKIIYGAGRLTIEYPESLAQAVPALSYLQIDAFISALLDTYLKRLIKNKNQ